MEGLDCIYDHERKEIDPGAEEAIGEKLPEAKTP